MFTIIRILRHLDNVTIILIFYHDSCVEESWRFRYVHGFSLLLYTSVLWMYIWVSYKYVQSVLYLCGTTGSYLVTYLFDTTLVSLYNKSLFLFIDIYGSHIEFFNNTTYFLWIVFFRVCYPKISTIKKFMSLDQIPSFFF